jgi:uncharacterized protein YgbK (DUF1537 family)
MTLAELLKGQLPSKVVPDARRQVRDALTKSGTHLVVIDDDPTGMQTVQDVSVFMDWSVGTLRKALRQPSPVFFVSVNSRSLAAADARALAMEVGGNLRAAVEREGSRILLASRSDSTLRGHFPYEVDALISALGFHPDGVILAPAFLEAGRFTVNDVHWAEQQGQLVPVHETEFAHDPMFSFKNSDLKAWVEEKTGGAVAAGNVMSIPLGLIRQGPEGVTAKLLGASNGVPIVVNAAEYADLDIVSLAVQSAESKGKQFVYRCSASFLKARGGFGDRPLLSHGEMVAWAGPGLIVAGSYVDKSSRQLQRLFDSGLAKPVELRVDEVISSNKRQEVARVAAEADRILLEGTTAAVYTTRRVRVSPDEDFAETGKRIMSGLCDVVATIKSRPAYVVAKGGVTSIQVAKTALGVNEAFALGQILPGVPVWRMGAESRWPGLAYVVFPGNVGDENAVLKAVQTLAGVGATP